MFTIAPWLNGSFDWITSRGNSDNYLMNFWRSKENFQKKKKYLREISGDICRGNSGGISGKISDKKSCKIFFNISLRNFRKKNVKDFLKGTCGVFAKGFYLRISGRFRKKSLMRFQKNPGGFSGRFPKGNFVRWILGEIPEGIFVLIFE